MLKRRLRCRQYDTEKGQSMVETAIVLPPVLLVMFAMINLALAGFASVNASNAANYGARVASVAQHNQAGIAMAAAQEMVDQAMVGEYRVSAGGGGRRGAQIVVSVDWSVPNFFGGLAAVFGGNFSSEIEGMARASFRQEGW